MATIVWFRQDLRLADNPALSFAAARGEVLPVYIRDPSSEEIGAAGQWWLHHSLAALRHALGQLYLFEGEPLAVLARLAEETGADTVAWNRCYTPKAIARDRAIKEAMALRGITTKDFNAALLHEPWQVATNTGGPFKIFTPYWRAARKLPVDAPLNPPERINLSSFRGGGRLADWMLLPTAPNWAAGWEKIWQPGEAGADTRLEGFVEKGLAGYADLRDRPDLSHVSRLSPHLHFGEISPRQVWARLDAAQARQPSLAPDIEKFRAEIGWREFSGQLLYHFPDMTAQNWRPEFDAYPWCDDEGALKAWQQGRTGYPMVDAGMRELWRTGYMHNRVRMLVASFLTKHLRIHWRHGQDWFADCLLDADTANNAANWQWVAGSGADAAPYFRIFNPIAQGRKFDPDGVYVRRWCPELAALPTEFIHAPFLAPAEILAGAGVVPGKDYPHPIVDHAEARARALEGYQTVRRSQN